MKKISVQLVPLGPAIHAREGTPLIDILHEYGVEFPCGGKGTCGKCRVKVLEECIRATGADGIICIFEPTEESINMIKQFEPSHPEAADPTECAGGLDLTSETIAGARFNTYLFRK